AAQVYHAMPLYYGIWLARQLGAGRFLPVTLGTDQNITAYAVRGDDGRLRVAVIDKGDTAVRLALNLGGRSGTAHVLHLTASGFTAADTAVQGATVDRSGHLRPGRSDAVRVRRGAATLDL